MDDNLSNGVVDKDTGEILNETISEKAIDARNRAHAVSSSIELGIGNSELYEALMRAMKALPIFITAETDNGAFKRDGKPLKYASLKDILKTVRPVLLEAGIRIRQGADRSFMLDEGGGMKGRLIPVYTDLIHSDSGEIDRTTIEIPLTRLDPQAMGSAITYGRRYSLVAALGLATDEADDDGETANSPTMRSSVDSADLAEIKRDIDKMSSATDLAIWGDRSEQRKRLAKLDAQEQGAAREYFNARARSLMNSGGDDAQQPKETKAGRK